MSDVKSEETSAVAEPPKAVEEVPATSSPDTTSAPEPAKLEEATAPVEANAEESKAEEKKDEPAEVKPITEGFLELKPPGLLHFIPTKNKKYFYLQDDPIAIENMQAYLKKDKSASAHSNVALASQTGKGLFFYTKNHEQKAHPIGAIKLIDVVDVISSGNTKFALKLTNNDVLHFESNASVRNSWVETIKAKVAEAKEVVESVVNSDGYKTTLERLTKPTAVAKSEAKEKEPEEAKHKETEGEKKEEDKEEKEKVKSDASSSSSSSSDDEGPSNKAEKKGKKVKRSASKKAKRASFFGIMGVKDKKKEEKKENEPNVDEAKVEPASEVPVAGEEVKPAEEGKPEEVPKAVETPAAEPVAPKYKNRHSVFGFFDKKKESEKKKEEEVKPEDAKTETQAESSEEAVKLADVPAEPGSKTPASPPRESFLDKFFKKDKSPVLTPVAAPETKNQEEVEVKPEEATIPEASKEAPKDADVKSEATSPKEAKRRSSFFASLGKKDKKPDVKSDTEDEVKANPSSPLPKKLGLFRSHSKSAKDAPKAETKEEVPPVPEVAPTITATETPAPDTTTEPTEPAPAAETNPVIGDVVADAVTVGQTNPVQAAA